MSKRVIGVASNISPRNYEVMEFEHEELLEPVSPTGQYLRSSALSLTIIGILELEIPIDESMAIQQIKDLFLPINRRFSSIMIAGENGEKKWKTVEVNLEEHVKFPRFPQGMSPDCYDDCLSNYLSKLGMEQLPADRPLWEIHILNYPTTNAAGSIVFKLHHALGDGYSLMGALLSCLQRLDDPSLPLTFPSRQSNRKSRAGSTFSSTICKVVPQIFSSLFSTVYDFGFGVLKSSLVEDDCSPIRSGRCGMEFRPMTMTPMTFSLDQIKQIKDKLQVTINDVITGMIMYGTRLYMQQTNPKSSMAKSTVLVLLNTRATQGYKSVSEMIKPNAEMPWGNRFSFLPLSLPELTESKCTTPLSFVLDANRIIKRQRKSASVYLTSKLLETVRKVKGPEATATYIHSTLKNSSMGITNLIGPTERVALANYPVKGIYFDVSGAPQSLRFTVMSYTGNLRICVVTEKDFIDPSKFKSCLDNAFETMFKAAIKPSTSAII